MVHWCNPILCGLDIDESSTMKYRGGINSISASTSPLLPPPRMSLHCGAKAGAYVNNQMVISPNYTTHVRDGRPASIS